MDNLKDKEAPGVYLVTIERKTSAYNKYMLWRIEGVAENSTGARFTDYTKTLNEARRKYDDRAGYKIIKIITKHAGTWKDPRYI